MTDPRPLIKTALDRLTRLSTLQPDSEGRDWIERVEDGHHRAAKLSDAANTPSEPGDGRPLHGDPTLRAVMDHEARHAREVRKQVDVLAERLDKATRELFDIAAATRPREASPKEKAEADRANTPGCSSHQRAGHHIETYRGDLCRWCYDRSSEVEGIRSPPPISEVRRHVEAEVESFARGKRAYVRG